MDNENNNADFDKTVGEVYPALKPAPNMTRKEFVDKVRNLCDESDELGDEDKSLHDWSVWIDELSNAYLNS